jgi:2-methylfumaryl-CoA hydratase
MTIAAKTNPGRYFDDFRLGETLVHPTPRTITLGDCALYAGLFGSRFALTSSDEAAKAVGHKTAPIDDLLVFHMVFGKTVPDISINAVANLGYAEGRFLLPVYPGDTLRAESIVIGLKETSAGDNGIVYVRTTGFNQHDQAVLSYVRWVLVRRNTELATTVPTHVPDLKTAVLADDLIVPAGLNFSTYRTEWTNADLYFDDYQIGEHIDHVDGMTVEEAEHQIATRLYQNTAKVHFNQFQEAQGRFARRLIYGGHVISLARALSFNGLNNAVHIAAINGGRHISPLFAGKTVFAWSEVLDTAIPAGQHGLGALRLRTRATKDHPCSDLPAEIDGKAHPALILDLDYWVLIPRRAALRSAKA